jgi:flavodoxin
MKALVVFDLLYGNTQKIAEAVARGLKKTLEVDLRPVSRVSLADLKGIDILVVGSPTHGGRPTPAIQAFLDKLPDSSLAGIKVAAFDTRVLAEEQSFGLKILVKTLGYAAPKIAAALKAKGGQEVDSPTGFIVEGKEGPLKAGEVVRAEKWPVLRESR